MGLCRDFGSQIAEGCNHPMRAGSASCHCEQCGVVCKGQFAACPSVWAQGPQPVVLAPAPSPSPIHDLIQGPARVHPDTGHEPPEAAATNGLTAVNGAEPITVEGPTDTSGPPDQPPAPAGDASAEVFRWFHAAFDALRQEVEGLRGALSQEQAMVATLLGSQRAAAGPDAEALRAVVDTAVREAVDGQTADLETTVDKVRRDLEGLRLAQDGHAADLQAAIAVAAAAAENVGLPVELNRRDATNRKAFRATLREELQPLVEVVAESIAQSDYELKALGRQLERISQSDDVLSAALDALTARVDELGASEAVLPESASGPFARPAGSGVLARLESGEAPLPAGGTTASRATASRRRTIPGAGVVGGASGASRGTRVSLRRPSPEG